MAQKESIMRYLETNTSAENDNQPRPSKRSHAWDDDRQQQQQQLAKPTQLHRVGASIGHKSPTLHALLTENIGNLFTDEEDGLVAMFVELHDSLPDPSPHIHQAIRRTLAKLWKWWNQVQTSEISRDVSGALTDDEIGLTAMMREMSQQVVGSSNNAAGSSSSSWGPTKEQFQSAQAFMDAMLAQMLHAFYQAKVAATDVAKEIPELVAPTPVGVIQDDVSLQGMFRELSQQWPGTSEEHFEEYMLGRLHTITEESIIAETVTSEDLDD